MVYTSIAALALMVHLIVNNSAIRNRHYQNNMPSGKAYRSLILAIMGFYIFDAAWGVLYEHNLIRAVYADTVFYFIAMALTVFLWTRYVICYLNVRNRFITLLSAIGWFFLCCMGIVLLLNFFYPVLFWFDESGGYHAEDLRYVSLALQVLLFLYAAVYTLITGIKKEASLKRRHRAIGMFGIMMSAMVMLQVFYPLLPMYAVGCLLGTCILHTFVLEDLNEDRRLELEAFLRKEQEQARELGSAKKMAYTDSLTGVKSKHAFVEAENQLDQAIANQEISEFGVIVFDINDLKQVNDTRGHDAGDNHIREGCRLICQHFKHSPVFRIGGDEFVAILKGEDYRNRKELIAAFETDIEDNRRENRVVVSSGLGLYRPGEDNSFRRVFERADQRMYDRKSTLKAMAQ